MVLQSMQPTLWQQNDGTFFDGDQTGVPTDVQPASVQKEIWH